MINESNLQRFIDAQEADYKIAFTEIRNARKQSHWMWYIFPQIQGLGISATTKYYAIKDINEAEEYLKHPVLGSRLIDICTELIQLKFNNANKIFGSPDDLKLKSCMTLFSSLHNTNSVFREVLKKFFDGTKDNKTLQIIDRQQQI